MRNFKLTYWLFIFTTIAVMTAACGPHESGQTSRLSWVSVDKNFANLEEKDFADDFLLSFTIIDHQGLEDEIIGLSPDVTFVTSLVAGKDIRGNPLLLVKSKTPDRKTLLQFSMQPNNMGSWKVDFASAANSLQLTQRINGFGGAHSSVDGSSWLSDGKPETVRVLQDDNQIVADIRHNIFVLKSSEGLPLRKQASIIARLVLKRRSMPPDGFVPLSWGTARQKGYLFIPSLSANDNKNNLPIVRLGQFPNIKFYLKNFEGPALESAKAAVLSWNQVFGGDVISVESASVDMEIGDPGLNVIRRLAEPDSTIKYSGATLHTLIDPDTGVAASSSILVTVPEGYMETVSYTDNVVTWFDGKFGNIDFQKKLEQYPFLTKPAAGSIAIAESDLIYATVLHEVGHALGLDHNFKASSLVDYSKGNISSSSVMDYTPIGNRLQQIAPGSLDKAAIQFAYLNTNEGNEGVPPPNCTNDEVGSDILCNIDDLGDPLPSVPRSTIKSLRMLSKVPVKLPENSSVLFWQFFTLNKFRTFSDQIPESRKRRTLSAVDSAFKLLDTLKPSLCLSATNQEIVEFNINLVRKSAKEAASQVAKEADERGAFSP